MPLSSEEKRNLKEGEIYIDEETQKKYRVKKAAFPQHQIGGPHGLGEPDDRSLRKVEADVLIPKLMNEAVEKIECHDLHLAIVNCFRLHGGVKGLKACAPERDIYNVCKIEKFSDPEFRARITDKYLHDRSEYRRTGLNKAERKVEAYREWKAQQGTAGGEQAKH